jgi:hypothetical protein
LNAKVISIERITKIYGSNAESFLLTLSSSKKRTTTYFLKFEDKDRANREIAGTKFVERFLPIPKILLAQKGKAPSVRWILFESVRGQLMAEKYLNIKSENDFKLFCELEQQKEVLLKFLYDQPATKISRGEYDTLPANRLFRERLCGDQYENFFKTGKKNISQYFDRYISINAHNFPLTVNEIFDSIRKKYSTQKDKRITVYMGHGDAHHGNIIAGRELKFIDNEYAGFLPPFMELAKPYYNDFLGVLFFHYHETLKQYFNIQHFEDDGTRLSFKIAAPQKLTRAIEITKIKLSSRKKWANAATDDFLLLNDYLILSHALTKNPNAYPLEVQLLFLAFIEILAQFDPFDPESIYRFL